MGGHPAEILAASSRNEQAHPVASGTARFASGSIQQGSWQAEIRPKSATMESLQQSNSIPADQHEQFICCCHSCPIHPKQAQRLGRVVLWCVVLCCGVVWCGVVWCGVLCCGVVWCGVVWCGVVWCGVVWCGVVWCGVVWCGVVWCGVVCCGGAQSESKHIWQPCLIRYSSAPRHGIASCSAATAATAAATAVGVLNDCWTMCLKGAHICVAGTYVGLRGAQRLAGMDAGKQRW